MRNRRNKSVLISQKNGDAWPPVMRATGSRGARRVSGKTKLEELRGRRKFEWPLEGRRPCERTAAGKGDEDRGLRQNSPFTNPTLLPPQFSNCSRSFSRRHRRPHVSMAGITKLSLYTSLDDHLGHSQQSHVDCLPRRLPRAPGLIPTYFYF